MTRIAVTQEDITSMHVDAIVNAANTALSSGSGVNGAIQRAAGPELLKECLSLNGCETGNAKMTKGYNLPAKYVIHTVGPVWQGGNHNEQQLLYNAYYRSLALAKDNNIRSIAFPNISTGIFGYPKREAAVTALNAIHDFCKKYPDAFNEIFLVCFDDENKNIYHEILKG